MSRNLGQTGLRGTWRSGCPMREFDDLPPQLRTWLASAILPWRPRSVRRAFERAMRRTRNPAEALKVLDEIQSRQIARDARDVWGGGYPLDSESRNT
ncbi:DUF6525 family protein [Wenxinia saemankumensis]|uniref:Uncharacterized protein n=1 Tax=Wenxinia saemankumensis TaxID=1447782 RepID=A0A1M6B2Z2_9RHOB|nr:DUF6525 family protein [Wenxinia saemankumensis]SHI43119.1 hypothetical protein SAMN05444417_0753 [Wenxinia saemankumensis]